MEQTKTTRKPRRKKAAATPSHSDFKKLKLLITVVNRKKAEFFMDFLQGFEVNAQMSMLAQGTARSDTLHMLGLEDADRSVIFSLIREDRADEILRGLDHKFTTVRGGKGIACTVPLSSVIGVAIYRFLSNNRAFSVEEK